MRYECPECESASWITFRPSVVFQDLRGWGALWSRLLNRGPHRIVRVGAVVMCANCAAQCEVLDGKVKRVLQPAGSRSQAPKRAEGQKDEEARERNPEAERESEFPWRR